MVLGNRFIRNLDATTSYTPSAMLQSSGAKESVLLTELHFRKYTLSVGEGLKVKYAAA